MNKLLESLDGRQFGTILIDPPWRFSNRTGKVGPEHKRLHRYQTMSFEDIAGLPVGEVALPKSHLYLWCPNALLAEALSIMKAWDARGWGEHRYVSRHPGVRRRGAFHRLNHAEHFKNPVAIETE